MINRYKPKENRHKLASSICFVLSISIIVLFAEKAAAAPILSEEDFFTLLNEFWVIIAALLVILMNAGFAILEAGFCRSKNVVNILFKNLIILAIATICFWAIGMAFAYGNGNNFIGWQGFFLMGEDNSPEVNSDYYGVFSALSWANISLAAKFLFQVAFAATAATIVSGAVAERIKLISYLCFSIVLVSFIYPLIVRQVWADGWLYNLGFYDFAGSTVVHSVGGWAALVGVITIGQRIRKYSQDGKVLPFLGHNLSLSTLGCFILWIGWFGFNAGSTLNFSLNNANIVLVTLLAGATGAIAAAITTWFKFGKPDLSLVINGVLSGLVAITASANCVDYLAAVVIGGVAGVIVVISVLSFDRSNIDDPVGAISVHLVNGIWGTIAVSLFANPTAYHGDDLAHLGILLGGELDELFVQLFGIIFVGVITVSTSWITWKAIDYLFGLRVKPEAEIMGLDLTEHQMVAYGEEDEPEVDYNQPSANNLTLAPPTRKQQKQKTIII